MKTIWLILILLAVSCGAQTNPTTEAELPIQTASEASHEAVLTEESAPPQPETQAEAPQVSGVERSYEWYLAQEHSGPFEADNCGPAVTVMSIRWYDPHKDVTIEQARSKYRPEGGWWYTNDIEAMLKETGTPMTYERYIAPGDITRVIDQGQIAILCIDTRFIQSKNDDVTKTGRHYEGDFGHFVIAKGYQEIEGKLYIEVYDPWNVDAFYEDGTPKGKNRLYPADEVDLAIRNWWSNIMVIGKPE